MNSFLLSVSVISTGIFWSLVYVLIIRQGFKDKATGMPMAALCANICWEFIFSFVYPLEGIKVMVTIIWFLLDVIIMLQFIKYGRKEFGKLYSIKYFYPTFLIAMLLSFSIITASATEFNDFEGIYAAFSQNLMMSILFIPFLLNRGSTKGQSVFIALFKMIGSLIPAVSFYLFYSSGFINLLCIATFVFDMIYLILLIKMKCYKVKKH